MKRARFTVEILEPRELLAVAAGAALDASAHSEPIAFAAPLPTADEGAVSLTGVGEKPVSGAGYADLSVHLSTSRAVASDFGTLSLYIGIQETGLATLSVSRFDPAKAGFQIGDASLDTVPDMTVVPLFTTNLISNGSWAFYLYAGGEEAPVAGAWYLKAVWFDLSLSGDWTGGADTVGKGIDLAALRLNVNPELVRPATIQVDFAADCGEDWTVEPSGYAAAVEPKTVSNLVALAAPNEVTVQDGCKFFLSGAGSYATGSRAISSWLWGYTSGGEADARGEELWFSSNKLRYTKNSAVVSLVIGDAAGNLSLPADVRVTRLPVAPSVTGALSSFAGGRVVLADVCYTDAAGEAGAFWEIDWGDGTVEEFTCLSNTLSASHVYESGGEAVPAVRVTNTAGETGSFVRIG
ncbi:MAG: hypothetical protein IKE69_05040 [Thermoguttaceae bacterium]|nr:hypothetical protein [Thermoguttaceae bacterium]